MRPADSDRTEPNVANYATVANGNRRQSERACASQPIHQIGLGRPPERHVNDDANAWNIAGSFPADGGCWIHMRERRPK